ncbi:helix-turn-helix domain-containing protein [Streptomyces anulatus]|uniref:helix-turn-helix domain-containing protein n=1 Tax=Streptomyces anulatus TaxID=1892 RepID=UPI00225147CE|nr:helix-turn-helix domain-containing protein [Streptomyces anulatus]MCX4605451.1 helix-turn-helix domain-containing protein [Streptomyces anulatus]
MTTHELHNRQRLAAKVRERRLELRVGVAAAAADAGMSKDTWRRVEEGAQVRETSYAKIDAALGWASGSCMGVLDGAASPIEMKGTRSKGGLAKIPDGELDQAITNAMVATVDNMTAAEIREVARRAVEELRRLGHV